MANASASWPTPPLDRSILGWDPTDEFSVLIGDWLAENGQGYTNLEIEAKVGRIIDQSTEQRIQIPVRTETIIEMQRGWRFESHMSDAQHQKINGLLNKAVEQSAGKITYQRQKEVDLFYTDESGMDPRGKKIRVTKDEESWSTKATIMKKRLNDINVYCPNRSLDYRISINVEEPRSESVVLFIALLTLFSDIFSLLQLSQ